MDDLTTMRKAEEMKQVVAAARGEILSDRDKRPQCYAWAPGTYECTCTECGWGFLGDKRATMCAPCAFGDNPK